MTFSVDESVYIPRIENRHIRCLNPSCRVCPPKRAARASVTRLESVHESHEVARPENVHLHSINTPSPSV